MTAKAAESSDGLKGISVDKLAPKLVGWGAAMIAGLMAAVGLGNQFYATKGELSSVRETVLELKIGQGYTTKEVQRVQSTQDAGFAKMETRFEQMEKLLSRERP